MKDKKLLKLSILSELASGKEPLKCDYVKENCLNEIEYSNLVKEMENEQLINKVQAAKDGHSNYLVIWFNGITSNGINYLKLNSENV